MKLTIDILRAAYSFLSETVPFSEWNLPDAEDVVFEVSHKKGAFGACWAPTMNKHGKFVVMISGYHHAHTNHVLETLAHEMVHIHEHQTALRKPHHGNRHSRAFYALAAEVCAEHGFDPGQF